MGRYQAIPHTVHAEQVEAETTVETKSGDVIANPGDWIVTHWSGNKTVLSGEYFYKLYEPIILTLEF